MPAGRVRRHFTGRPVWAEGDMTGQTRQGAVRYAGGIRKTGLFQTGIPADSRAAACRKNNRTLFYPARMGCVEYWVSPLLTFACVGLFFWLTLRANQEGAHWRMNGKI